MTETTNERSVLVRWLAACSNQSNWNPAKDRPTRIPWGSGCRRWGRLCHTRAGRGVDKHTGRLSPHTSLRGPASLTCQHNTNFPSERVLTRDQGPREEQTNGTAEFFYNDTTVSYRYYVCLLIGVTSRQFASDCKLHGVMYVGPTDETKKWRSGDAVLQFAWLLLFCFVLFCFVLFFSVWSTLGT